MYGCPEVVPDDLHGLVMRRNLELYRLEGVPGDAPILQRFGPSRLYLHWVLKLEMREGCCLLDAVLDTCKVAPSADKRAQMERAGSVKLGKMGRSHVAQLDAAHRVAQERSPNGAGRWRNSAGVRESGVGEQDLAGGEISGKTAGSQKGATRLSRDGHYHIGVWYGQGGKHLTPSSDLRQERGQPDAVGNIL